MIPHPRPCGFPQGEPLTNLLNQALGEFKMKLQDAYFSSLHVTEPKKGEPSFMQSLLILNQQRVEGTFLLHCILTHSTFRAMTEAELGAGVAKMSWSFSPYGLTFPQGSPSYLPYMPKTLKSIFPAQPLSSFQTSAQYIKQFFKHFLMGFPQGH